MFASPTLALAVLSAASSTSGAAQPMALGFPTSASPVPAPPPPARAMVPTLFELEGDAIHNFPTSPPDDWDLLYQGGGSADTFTGILCDRAGQGCQPEVADKIFVGGRKDIQDLSEWGWKAASGLPDKDDITNAYAAAYTEPASADQLIYFGLDRYSNVGDAFAGYWFLQNAVFPNANGRFSQVNADGSISPAHHVDGDILVLVNYPQASGASPEFDVIMWQFGANGVGQNLVSICTQNCTFICGDVPPAPVCDTTNLVGTPSPWPYVPKAGSPGVFPFESFFEGGIDLQALGLPRTCFASFIAETRSSEQFTATLKDFSLGAFDTCSISVASTCEVTGHDASFTDYTVHYQACVSNDGAGTFPIGSVVTIQAGQQTGACPVCANASCTPPGGPAALTRTLTQPLVPGGTVCLEGDFHTPCNPVLYTVHAEIHAGQVGAEADATGTCELILPDMMLEKNCDAVTLVSSGTSLCIRVDFTGTVTNTGNQPLNVVMSDTPTATISPSSFSLPVGGVQQITGYYFPSTADNGSTTPCTASFTDTLTAVGTCQNQGCPGTITRTATAVCRLCPCPP